MQLPQKSIFEFSDPALEATYQTFLLTHVKNYSIGLCLGILLGFVCMLVRIFADLRTESFTVPPELLPALLLSFLPAGIAALLIYFCPKFYSKHWRNINLLWKCLKLCAVPYLQQLVLWMQVRRLAYTRPTSSTAAVHARQYMACCTTGNVHAVSSARGPLRSNHCLP